VEVYPFFATKLSFQRALRRDCSPGKGCRAQKTSNNKIQAISGQSCHSPNWCPTHLSRTLKGEFTP
jgi:hypothetical protein